MKKSTKIVLLIIGSFIILLVTIGLVWGSTIRMAYANHLFKTGKFDQSRKIYEDMAVDAPKSPYILHNQGLSSYQSQDYQKSNTGIQKATELMTAEKLPTVLKNKLDHRFQYHLGNSFFKLAAKAQDEQSKSLYQNALQAYRKAIETNPSDPDAKYNYELTKLRLANHAQSQSQQQPPPQPKKDSENVLNAAKQEEKYQLNVPIPDAPVDKDW